MASATHCSILLASRCNIRFLPGTHTRMHARQVARSPGPRNRARRRRLSSVSVGAGPRPKAMSHVPRVRRVTSSGRRARVDVSVSVFGPLCCQRSLQPVSPRLAARCCCCRGRWTLRTWPADLGCETARVRCRRVSAAAARASGLLAAGRRAEPGLPRGHGLRPATSGQRLGASASRPRGVKHVANSIATAPCVLPSSPETGVRLLAAAAPRS